jgi:multidrug efflux pump subunit AcrA (membrane-fusion protein)
MNTLRFSALLLLGVMLAGCGKKEKEPEPVVPVQVSPAIRGSIRNIINADAILFPRDQANIMPKLTAPVRRFLVNRGDRVRAGQLLAELENRDLVAAAVASRGQFGQAESNYRVTASANVPEQVTKAQSDADAARQTLDAAKKLLDSREQLFKEGALARKLVEEARVSYAQARALFDTAQEHLQALQRVGKEEQIKAAAAQVEAAKGQYESAQAQVGYSEVRSPINGVVSDRPFYPGEIANPGTPLLTVMDNSAVVARINMGANQAANIKVGSPATLAPADGGDPVPGKVTIVSPATDPNTTTIQIWVQADNAGGRLRVGTPVHVAIVAETVDALLIHASAVLPSDEGGTKAMVVDDKNIAHEKKIQTGVKEGDLVQVVSGLQPGDRVITGGGLGLDDKAKVRVLKPGERRPGEEEKKDDDEDDK